MKISKRDSKPASGIKDGGDDLPEWFLIEVLIRLPVKLIFRFKLVCKHWLSVISDPSFARTYISRAPLLHPLPPWDVASCVVLFDCSRFTFLKYETVDKIYTSEPKRPRFLIYHLPIHQPQLENSSSIYGTSNGLVLCAVPDNLEGALSYNVCNPITGQWIRVRSPTRQFKNVHWGFLTRVEDGMLKSFRVVCLDLCSVRTNTIISHVFFSESGEWKDFSLSSSLEIEILDPRPPADLHGNLHWLLRKNGILAYDPYNKPDDLRIIPLPSERAQEYDPRKLSCVSSLCGVSDGKLRYFQISGIDRQAAVYFEIWILNEYSSEDWSLQNKISCFDIHRDVVLFSLNTVISPVSFDPFDSDIVHLAYMDVIVSYNIKTKRSEAYCHPLSNEEILPRVSRSRFSWGISRFSWGMGVFFVIPPWPTSIYSSPSFRSFEK